MIKAVIFDIDGTLYDYDSGHITAMKAVAQYCGENLGVDEATVYRVYEEANRRAIDRIGYSCAAIHNRQIRYQCMLELLNRPLFPHATNLCHTYWGTMLEEMKPFEGLTEWMGCLKKQGIAVGICSNMTAYIQYLKLEKLGVTSCIDWIVTSEEAGVEKPEPKIFRQCLEKSGVRAEECLFIGDSLNGDVMGAAGVGMKALLFAPDAPEAASGDRSYGVLRSYQECLEPGFLDGI